MVPLLQRLVLLLVITFYRESVCESVCKTKACRNTANRISEYIDNAVRPCDDFYRFACGNFLKIAKIPDDKTQNSSFTQVDEILEHQLKSIVYSKPHPREPLPYRNLRHLFAICMDEEAIDSRGIEHALSKLKAAGGWPALGQWSDENWNFLDTEIELRNQFIGGGSLFLMGVTIDAKNTSRRIVALDQAGLGLSREFLVKGVDDPIVKAYYSYMVDIAVLYGGSRTTASEQLKKSLLFEIELAKLTTPREERRVFDRMYNLYTLKELKTEIPWVDWKKLLKNVMPTSVQPKTDEPIVVSEVDFLKKLEHLLKNYSSEVIANHMMWHAAGDLSGMLTNAMRDRSLEYRKVVFGTTKREPRWKECIGVAGSLAIALSSLYVKEYFDQTSKKEALDMAERIRLEMANDIQEVDWMDDQTRSNALHKASKVVEHIGYPDELSDISKIERFYEGLKLNNKHYFETILDMSRWAKNETYHRLRQPVNKTDWRTHSDVTMVNAYYNPIENSMQFPAGILQFPFFNAEVPKYVNYAGIGFVMAHEITHGFDDMGSQFNSEGDLKEWWDDESIKRFNDKKKCFINQYGGFMDKQTQLHLNGINTQGENVADNGGLKVTYRAYKRLDVQEPLLPGLENYTQDQLFMINMANLWCTKYRSQALKYQITTGMHPPAEFRVNGALKNLPEFSEIFKCSENDPMNPAEKCGVW